MSKGSRAAIWVPIVTALVGAAATIAVSYIGIVPQLRKLDSEKIEALTIKLRNQNLGASGLGGTFTMSGTAFQSPHSNVALANVELFLLPATGNDFMTTTDDNGAFQFRGIPNSRWWIVVRNTNSDGKPSGRFLLEPGNVNEEFSIMGASLKCRMVLEQ